MKNGSIRMWGMVGALCCGMSMSAQEVRHFTSEAFADEDIAVVAEETASPADSVIVSGPRRGFRGLVDLSHAEGVGGYGENRVGMYLTHGYQVWPFLMLGTGVGIQYFYNVEEVEVPVYGYIRSDFLDRKKTPWAAMKVGYAIRNESVFFAPSVGCRFGVKPHLGVNLSIGYTWQRLPLEHKYSYTDETCEAQQYFVKRKTASGGLHIELGVEF